MAKKASTRGRASVERPKTKKAAKPAKSASRSAPSGGTGEQRKRLDRELLGLLSKRFELARESLEASEDLAAKLYNPASDDELYREIEALNPGPLPAATARRIYQELLSAARAAVRVVRVAYLGPEYSFSRLAALERFGSSAELAPVATIAAVFEEVNRGHATYG